MSEPVPLPQLHSAIYTLSFVIQYIGNDTRPVQNYANDTQATK